MTYSRILSFALTLIFTFCICIFYYKKDTKNSNKKLPLKQRVLERNAQEWARTYDPKTGKVPSERLLKASKVIEKRYREKTAIPNIEWQERGPNNVSGRTRCVMIDSRDPSGNTIFAGGVSGGIWKSTNGGTTWTVINEFYNNLSVTSIVQDPTNANIIYFGTGEYWAGIYGIRGNGIYKSTNGGNSFSPIPFTVNNPSFEFTNRLAIQVYNGVVTLYAATSSTDASRGGLLFTRDGGANWFVFKGNNGGINDFASDVVITAPDPNNNNQTIVLAAFGGGVTQGIESDGVYFSLNGGSNWSLYYSALSTEGRIDLATAPSNPYINYMICEEKRTGFPVTMRGTWTADGVNYNWVPITPPSQGHVDGNCTPTSQDITRGQDYYDLAIAVSPNNPYRLLVGGIDLWTYERHPTLLTDNWRQISNWAGICGFQKVHADQHYIVYENANEVYVGNDGGVWKTNNAGAAVPGFTFKGNTLNITQFYCADIHPGAGANKYIAGAQDNGTQYFNMSGVNNTNEVVGGDGMFCHIDQQNGNVQIAAYTFQNMFVSLNEWQTQTQGTGGGKGRFVNPTDYDDINKMVYAGDDPGKYFRWNNPASQGTSSSTVTVSGFPLNLPDGRIWTIRNSPNVASRAYFGFDGGIVVKVDNAHSGTSKTGVQILNLGLGAGHAVSCIEIQPGNENHMLVTLSNYGITSVYESFNAASGNPTWRAVEGNLPDMPVRWAMFNPNNPDQAFLATELGVWSTTNLNGNATDWDPTNMGLANTRIDMIKFRNSDKQMVVATYGRGLFTSDALAGGCSEELALNGLTASGEYQANTSIQSTNVIIPSNATFNAPDVSIYPEFTINNGGTFEVQSDGCD